MDLNADFSQRVVLHAPDLPWTSSPMPGVSRRKLDRIGDEVARATTIVRYDPGSHFSPHVHTGGEEFIVLEGVFQDEHGDFPVGSYIRNPPQSRHTPGSEPGCVIFVKLWQFELSDRTHVRTHIDKIGEQPAVARNGVSAAPLYRDSREEVRVERWEAGAQVAVDCTGGAELLVLEGGFEEGGDTLAKHSWLRVPSGGQLLAKAGPQGARIWLKTGHLQHARPPAV